MRDISTTMAAALASGHTTFCRCWLLERNDGAKLGFTDHDRDLTFGGVTYEAHAGMTASAVNQTLALNVDTLDVSGALQSTHLNEADLAAGLFDNAALTLYLVDWTNPADRDVIFAGSIGEVSRGRTAFRAEMRGLAHALNQPRGRVYQRSCDADLGDGRCKVNLASGTWRGTGTVTGVSANYAFAAAGLGAYADAWFTGGLVTWTSGLNAGAKMEVKTHANTGAAVAIELWETMAFDIAPGDGFTVTAGCDKSLATCRSRFGNVANYRGYPFIPGNDAITSYATTGGNNSGGSRV